MDLDNHFSEEDRDKVVDFLNHIAKTARFELDTEGVIKHFRGLSFMQSVLLKKIDAHIFELKKITPAPKKARASKAKAAK